MNLPMKKFKYITIYIKIYTKTVMRSTDFVIYTFYCKSDDDNMNLSLSLIQLVKPFALFSVPKPCYY